MISTHIRSRAIIAAVAFAASGALAPFSRAQALLNPASLTKYLDPLPNPLANAISPTGTLDGSPLYNVGISQFTQKLHSQLAPTTLWGYNGTFPGPTFDVSRGAQIKVKWTNNLVDGAGAPLPHFLPYDNNLHGTMDHSGSGPQLYPQARVVTHLHGGVVDEQSDGYPEHWFTPDANAAPNGLGGPAGNSMVTTYPNNQRASTLWYHDHAMAITRLNIYAGMAGFYINRDPAESALNLPAGKFEVPMLFQDRSFYEDGSLYYPGDGSQGEPVGHTQQFFGDVNLVNGVVWPSLDVEPRKYRFRMLNGANSRAYNMSIVPDAGSPTTNPVTLYQIGTDGGLLPAPVSRTNIDLAAADRSDVIVDFSQFQVGNTLRMFNSGLNATGETNQVMQFRIVSPTGIDDSSLPSSLVPVPRYNPADAVLTRRLTLTRRIETDGSVQMLLNGRLWSDAVTEILALHQPEIWEITNATPDDHPIHLHQEAFQLLSRSGGVNVDIPLQPQELGWEDTVLIPRSQRVRIMVKYDQFAGQFVWHCHLLEHEDHEMMRPFRVEVPEPGSAALAAAALFAGAHWRRRRAA